MPSAGQWQSMEKDLDLSQLGDKAIFDVSSLSKVSVFGVARGDVSASTTKIRLKWSNDGTLFLDFSTPKETTVATACGIEPFDGGFRYLRVETTTAVTASAKMRITVAGILSQTIVLPGVTGGGGSGGGDGTGVSPGGGTPGGGGLVLD